MRTSLCKMPEIIAAATRFAKGMNARIHTCWHSGLLAHSMPAIGEWKGGMNKGRIISGVIAAGLAAAVVLAASLMPAGGAAAPATAAADRWQSTLNKLGSTSFAAREE